MTLFVAEGNIRALLFWVLYASPSSLNTIRVCSQGPKEHL